MKEITYFRLSPFLVKNGGVGSIKGRQGGVGIPYAFLHGFHSCKGELDADTALPIAGNIGKKGKTGNIGIKGSTEISGSTKRPASMTILQSAGRMHYCH